MFNVPDFDKWISELNVVQQEKQESTESNLSGEIGRQRWCSFFSSTKITPRYHLCRIRTSRCLSHYPREFYQCQARNPARGRLCHSEYKLAKDFDREEDGSDRDNMIGIDCRA
jgi:hypothetical protein